MNLRITDSQSHDVQLISFDEQQLLVGGALRTGLALVCDDDAPSLGDTSGTLCNSVGDPRAFTPESLDGGAGGAGGATFDGACTNN